MAIEQIKFLRESDGDATPIPAQLFTRTPLDDVGLLIVENYRHGLVSISETHGSSSTPATSAASKLELEPELQCQGTYCLLQFSTSASKIPTMQVEGWSTRTQTSCAANLILLSG